MQQQALERIRQKHTGHYEILVAGEWQTPKEDEVTALLNHCIKSKMYDICVLEFDELEADVLSAAEEMTNYNEPCKRANARIDWILGPLCMQQRHIGKQLAQGIYPCSNFHTVVHLVL